MSEPEGQSWKNAVSVEYRKINPACAYCGGDVAVVRVANIISGESFISTLCEPCAEKEIQQIVEEEGFEKLPKRSSFLNSSMLESVSNEEAKTLAKIFGLDLFIAEEESETEREERRQVHMDGLGLTGCRSARDGECNWRGCPQLRDGEPKKSGRHCPLDVAESEGG